MTHSRAAFVFVLAAAALGALSACAQSGGSPAGTQGTAANAGTGRAPESGAAGLGLLQNSQVQKDLSLTDEQRVQILTLGMEVREGRRDVTQRLAEILNPAQFQRLRQIRLQVEGPAAINNPEIAKTLDLTREQRAKLNALQEQIRAKVREASRSVQSLTTEERREKIGGIVRMLDQLRSETTEQAMEILTPRQREIFQELQGPKLDLTPPPPKPAATPAKDKPPEKDKKEDAAK